MAAYIGAPPPHFRKRKQRDPSPTAPSPEEPTPARRDAFGVTPSRSARVYKTYAHKRTRSYASSSAGDEPDEAEEEQSCESDNVCSLASGRTTSQSQSHVGAGHSTSRKPMDIVCALMVQHRILMALSVCISSYPTRDMSCYISFMKNNHRDGDVDGDALVFVAPVSVVRMPFHAHICVYDHWAIVHPRDSTSEVIAQSCLQSIEHAKFHYMLLCGVLFKTRLSNVQSLQLPVPLLRRNLRPRSNTECPHARLRPSRRDP